MDIEELGGHNWSDNRREVMSAILNKMSEFFCPPDRELALRGQIKTGWSTVAARKKLRPSQTKLLPQEKQHIQAVVAQAEAMQMAEEIRIGVQMLKLQRLRKSCRGNGTSTCVLCGYDLVHHRSRSLSSIHVCFECAQSVCSRCKADYKCHNGDTVVLCRLCSDERDLWKKSGAWLNNNLPVIHVSEDELEKAQIQRTTMTMRPLRTDLIVPASHLDEDDDELEDDLSTVSGSTANYGGFSSFIANSAPSSRSPSPPDMSFMASEPNAAAAAWKGDRQNSAELHPQSHFSLPYGKSPTAMRKSGSYDLVAMRNRQRSSTMPSKERSASITRKPAMSGERKERMEVLRRKVIEKKRVADLQKSGGDIQRTPSPTLGVDPLTMTRSHSNDFPVTNPRYSPVPKSTSPHPHIKVVVSTPPTYPDMGRGGENPRSASPLTASTIARDATPKSHDSETTHASVSSGSPHTDSSPSVDGKKRKPVAAPRKKQGTVEHEASMQQGRTRDGGELNLVAEGRKYATIEREKPSAAPRKRAGSLDKDGSHEYRSETLDRKQRGGRTPDPPPSSEFRTVNLSSKKTPSVVESKSTYSSVFPAEVSSELKSSLGARSKRSARGEEDSFQHLHQEEEDQANPLLKDIGKTVSITSEGSVDSQQGGEGVSRADSGSSGEHTWRRQGAKRTGRSRNPRHTMEVEDEDQGQRGRLRSGALSGGGGRAARRTHSGEDGEGSRSRTRSGALSGSDAHALRRGRNHRGSPRPRGGVEFETDGGFPEPLEHFEVEEAESIRRARAGDRRAARTGGDLLVATDGQYGSVELSMEYLVEDQILSVTIHRCRGLSGVDRSGLSDPYVKMFISPAPKKHVVFKTVIMRHTVNPQFDQNFSFSNLTPDCLEKKSIVLVVLDRHDASKDHPIGGISVPLYEVTPGQKTNIRKLLGDPEKAVKEVLEKTEVGKVELNFKCDPMSNVLLVGINQAVIFTSRSKSYPSSYVTCHLQTQTMSVNVKRKTKTVNRAAMPIFDQVLEFSVACAQLSSAVLTVSMWDHRKMAKDVFIGPFSPHTLLVMRFTDPAIAVTHEGQFVIGLTLMALGEVVLKGRRFWEKVKSSDLLNHEWFHLQEQDSLRVSSPVLAL